MPDLFERVVRLGLALPGVETTTSYGTSALKVRKKLLARLWEDGETLVVPCESIDEKEFLIATEPEVYFQTPHYAGWPSVLVRLNVVTEARLGEMLESAWRRLAGPRAVAAYDAAIAGAPPSAGALPPLPRRSPRVPSR